MQPASRRFLLIDGLRGIAAISVLLHHFGDHLNVIPLKEALPSIVQRAVELGGVGVAIFFVISGFVIAHSIGQRALTWGYVGNFIVRRSIRLDPPYWLTIVIVIVLGVLKNIAFNERLFVMPSAGSILAHATYTFGFFGYEPILPVFWTLCHEVQFYLTYCLLLGLFRRREGQWPIWPFVVTALLSLWYQPDIPGAALATWWMFATGVLMYCYYAVPSERRMVLAYLVSAVIMVCLQPMPYHVTALCTAGLILVAIHCDGLTRWLSAAPIQFLGAISYSLYLVHGVIGWVTISIVGKVLKSHSVSMATVALLAGIVTSLIAACLMRRFVELPSMQLANRLKSGRPSA